MKNKSLLIIILYFFFKNVFAEEINIKATNISIDKNEETTIFRDNVVIKDEIGNVIKSNYARYDKKNNLIFLENEVIALDIHKNILKAEKATYNKKSQIFKTEGNTSFSSDKGYFLESSDIILDKKNNKIFSEKNSILRDVDENIINLDNFEYISDKSIFNSTGKIEIKDKKNNTYLFTQIIIDTKRREIIGTDVKAYLNDEQFKINKKNNPRIFANTAYIKEQQTKFQKSAFTICGYREKDKCPPWELSAKEMSHDSVKKTIYYENVTIKVYDVPILFFPYFFHPDPTVKRRSGFLTPSFVNSQSLGASQNIPYFYALSDDKDLTITNRLFNEQHPLVLAEYRQAFKQSNLTIDLGFTEGLKKTQAKYNSGTRSHSFLKFVKNFNYKKAVNELKIDLQNISNRKYLKTYKLQTDLVDYNNNILENSFKFNSTSEDNYFGMETTVFKDLKDDKKERYEYILPNLTFSKNFLNNQTIGNIDLLSNFKIENYETNKTKKIFVNDLSWNYKNLFFENGIKSKIFSEIKNINYETKNIEFYKNDLNNELKGAIGYFSEIDFYKNRNNLNHLLTPKILFKYAPGSMRNELSGSKIDSSNIFSLNRASSNDNFESGLSTTLGFDYEVNSQNNKFTFSAGQIINQKENKKMSSETSLDEKLSDFVGSSNFNYKDKFNVKYNFSLDQNYKDLNYNDINANLNFNVVDLNFNYLKEQKHYGNNEYIETSLNYKKGSNGIISFKNKRNLISNSSEFYDLSYEYINDCLRAGLVYRREFYNDADTEPENSLMFKITLIPFGNVASQSIDQ